MMKGILGAKSSTIILILAVVLGAVFLGYVKVPQGIGGAGGAGTPAGSQVVLGTCDVDDPLSTTDIQYVAKRSIPDSDGSSDIIQGTFTTYLSGDTSPRDTMTYVSATGFQSTTADPKCGSSVYATWENTTFYNDTLGTFTADGQSVQKTFFVDTIATQQITAAEETSGTFNATAGLNISLATGGSTTVSAKIKANTAQGVLRGPFIIAVSHNDTNISNTATKIVGSESIACPGQATGETYTNCWKTSFTSAIKGKQNRLEDYDYVILPLRLEATSAGNPQGGTDLLGYVRVRVYDLGGYIQNGQYTPAYTATDATSDLGAATVSYLIKLH